MDFPGVPELLERSCALTRLHGGTAPRRTTAALNLSRNQCPSPPQRAYWRSRTTSSSRQEWPHVTPTWSCGTTQQLELPGNPHNIQRRQLGGDVKACPQLEEAPSPPLWSHAEPRCPLPRRKSAEVLEGQEECGQCFSNTSMRRDPRRLAEAQSAASHPRSFECRAKDVHF